MKKIEKFKEYFKDHLLTVVQDNDVCKIYEFRSPETGNLAQTWIICKATLIVLGDAYDSIYRGGAFSNLASIANCNINYFSSKCVSDKDGVNQSVFDSDTATKSIHRLIYNHWEDELSLNEEMEASEFLAIIETHINDNTRGYVDIPKCFENDYDTVSWLRENDEVVGPDWWDGLRLNEMTNVPFWHLAAIKVAVENLNKETNETKN